MRGKPLASSESLTGCLRWSGKTKSGKRLPMTRSGCIDVSSLTHLVSGAKRSSSSAHLTVLWGATQGVRRAREMGRCEAQQEKGGACRQRHTPAAGQGGPIFRFGLREEELCAQGSCRWCLPACFSEAAS